MSSTIATRMVFPETGDHQAVFTYTQDVAPILRWNREARNDGAGWSPSREMVHVGRVPITVLRHWALHEGIDYLSMDPDMTARLMAKIHEYNRFQVAEGTFLRKPRREYGAWNRGG